MITKLNVLNPLKLQDSDDLDEGVELDEEKLEDEDESEENSEEKLNDGFENENENLE